MRPASLLSDRKDHAENERCKQRPPGLTTLPVAKQKVAEDEREAG
jgi:hypothetical protein